jgi:hypothetical protein
MDPKFARDFGYLDKFFVSLTAHADTLPPAAGARLKQIIGEEASRWNEVRSLLSGGAVVVPTASAASNNAPPPQVVVPSPSAAPVPSGKPAPALTVGSLMGQPK